MYIRSHFRDCLAWRAENLTMSTTCDNAVKLYDSATQQLLTFQEDKELDGLGGTIARMLEADPNFIMGKVMATGLATFESNSRISDQIKKNVNELIELSKGASVTEWEKMHCEAVVEMAAGNRLKASQIWEEIAMLYPRDIFALKNAHINYIYMGNSMMLRDLVARALPYWKRSDPEYGYLLNMHAFGLEETNLYAAAEKAVLDGLSLAPEDQWGIHTAAHIYESTCRYEKAGDILLKTEPSWGEHGGLACHNYWHLSNYYLETNSFDKALGVFDEHIKRKMISGHAAMSVDDGCQLLQKLQFEGVDVGDRWDNVYESYLSNSPQNFVCYHDVLKLFSFSKATKAKELDNENSLIQAAEDYMNTVDDYNSKLTREIGLDAMKGVVAYNEERYDDAVELLYPLKDRFAMLGGSNAQRDIFTLLLINACLNSKSVKNHKIGRCLLYERKSLRPNSTLTERLVARLLALHSVE